MAQGGSAESFGEQLEVDFRSDPRHMERKVRLKVPGRQNHKKGRGGRTLDHACQCYCFWPLDTVLTRLHPNIRVCYSSEFRTGVIDAARCC